jgi:hypothetical protein
MAENGDARDERLAGLLDVEPLDELTRRRLVATALRASAPAARGSGAARSRRLVAAAVAVGVVFAAGVGYLATRDDGSGTTTTASRDRSAPTSPPVPATGSTGGSESFSTDAEPTAGGLQVEPKRYAGEGTPRDAGDFGDLRSATNLDQLRRAFASAGAATSADAATSDRVTSLLTQLHARSCASELPAGTVVAVATARFGTRDAIVVQTERPDGTRSIDAVVAHPCEVRPLD